MSARLGISRAAVAKHVSALRFAGHAIESATKKGYRLAIATDSLTESSVLALLQTKTLGQQDWLNLSQTTSTNREAIVWAANGAKSGSIVLAERQTEGRGRRGRKWFSAPRGIQFSLILRPKMQNTQLYLLTTLATVAVAESILDLTSLKAVIKPPNDILVKSLKVCGVLAEAGLQGEDVDWAVVGIGCNVNAQKADFPAELQNLTTSLFAEGKTPVSRSLLLANILERLEYWYNILCQGQAEMLEDRWQELVNK